MASWLLAIPYLLTGIGFILIAWAAGGYAHALLCGSRHATSNPWYLNATGIGLLLLVVRIAAGLALISWIGAVLGVAEFFRVEIVYAILLPLIMLGLPVAHRFAIRHKPMLLRDRLDTGYSWLSSPRAERIFGAVIILGFCAMIVNAVIGALVPDMNQDPMWYHLSVPQQWVFDQRFGTYPDVMPSAYPLAVESIYGIIFLLKTDPVLCSLLSALSGALLFTAMAGAAAIAVPTDGAITRLRGWGIAAVIGIWAPMITVYGMIAPVQPKNDIITMLWAFSGGMLIWLPLLKTGEVLSIKWWAVAGFLLGTACSAKPPVLGISFFLLVFAVVAYGRNEWRSRGGFPLQTLRGTIVCGFMMLLAAAPWMFRGWQSHGLPLYPLGYSLFHTAPEYQPLLNRFYQLHDVANSSVSDWFGMIMVFPERLSASGSNGEKCAFIFITMCVVGLLCARGIWRWYAAMLTAQLVVLIGMKGGDEIYRLFASAYCLAAPLIAWVVATYAAQLSRGLRLTAGALIYMGAMASVGWHQYRIATFTTMDWQFRPVLAKEDVEAYAQHAEIGWLQLDLGAIRGQIAKSERVFLVGATYPFYLHRDTLWNDEAIIEGGVALKWSAMAPQDAVDFISRQNIDVVLYAPGAAKLKNSEGPLAALVKQDVLQKVKIPRYLSEKGWALYRVYL